MACSRRSWASLRATYPAALVRPPRLQSRPCTQRPYLSYRLVATCAILCDAGAALDLHGILAEVRDTVAKRDARRAREAMRSLWAGTWPQLFNKPRKPPAHPSPPPGRRSPRMLGGLTAPLPWPPRPNLGLSSLLRRARSLRRNCSASMRAPGSCGEPLGTPPNPP